jgi:hypothetical protein
MDDELRRLDGNLQRVLGSMGLEELEVVTLRVMGECARRGVVVGPLWIEVQERFARARRWREWLRERKLGAR